MPPKHKCHGKRVQRYYNFANLASFFLFFSSFVGKLARNRPHHYLRFLEKVKTFTGLFNVFSWSFKINKVLLQPETNTNSITMMKKLLFLGCFLVASMNIMADDVKTIDAAKVSKITFSGDNVTIKFNDGTPDLTVDMETVTLDFSNVTAIERVAIAKEKGLEGKAIYNMKGQLVGNSVANLSQGIYIINGKKVVIK